MRLVSLIIMALITASWHSFADDLEKLKQLAERAPEEVAEICRLYIDSYDHADPDIRAFARKYAPILVSTAWNEALNNSFNTATAQAIREGSPAYAAFATVLARQAGVYDSEDSHLPQSAVQPMVERLLDTGRPQSDEEGRLKSLLAHVLKDIALGRKVLHFGNPRFFGDKLMKNPPGRDLYRELIHFLDETKEARTFTNLALFLAMDAPARSGGEPMLPRLVGRVDELDSDSRKTVTDTLGRFERLLPEERRLLQSLTGDDASKLKALVEADCDDVYRLLAEPSSLVPPIRALPKLF